MSFVTGIAESEREYFPLEREAIETSPSSSVLIESAVIQQLFTV